MSLVPSNRSLRIASVLLLCFMVLTPLAGSRIFVSAALQRAEFYAAGVLHGAAERPSAHAAHRAGGTARPASVGHVSALNFFLHLSGIFVPVSSTDWLLRSSGGTLATVVTALPMWELVFAIFEPPKRLASLS